MQAAHRLPQKIVLSGRILCDGSGTSQRTALIPVFGIQSWETAKIMKKQNEANMGQMRINVMPD